MIPKGYSQIAETLLPGTGGVSAVAYQKRVEGEKKLFVLFRDPIEGEIEMGPFPVRYLATLNHIIQDVLFLNGISK